MKLGLSFQTISSHTQVRDRTHFQPPRKRAFSWPIHLESRGARKRQSWSLKLGSLTLRPMGRRQRTQFEQETRDSGACGNRYALGRNDLLATPHLPNPLPYLQKGRSLACEAASGALGFHGARLGHSQSVPLSAQNCHTPMPCP